MREKIQKSFQTEELFSNCWQIPHPKFWDNEAASCRITVVGGPNGPSRSNLFRSGAKPQSHSVCADERQPAWDGRFDKAAHPKYEEKALTVDGFCTCCLVSSHN